MLSLAIYLLIYFIRTGKRIIYLYLTTFLAIAMTLLINLTGKPNFIFFEEINFSLKTMYYVVMLFTVYMLIEKRGALTKETLYRAANLVAIFIGVSYWVAYITNTSMKSYNHGGLGYSGWFFAANELSVTVLILLGISIAHLHREVFSRKPFMINSNHELAFLPHVKKIDVLRRQTFTAWFGFILMVSMLPMIGTKTAFGGGVILVFIYAITLLATYRMKVLEVSVSMAYFTVLLIFIGTTPFTPIIKNTQFTNLGANVQTSPVERLENRASEAHPVVRKILSSRDIYFYDKLEDFERASTIRKAFGLGYAGDYHGTPKVIEMDFFDLFFSYGFVGSIILLLPLLLLIFKRTLLPLTTEKMILLTTLALCLGVSFLAGHVLFAPSVMTYVAILLLLLHVASGDRGRAIL